MEIMDLFAIAMLGIVGLVGFTALAIRHPLWVCSLIVAAFLIVRHLAP